MPIVRMIRKKWSSGTLRVTTCGYEEHDHDAVPFRAGFIILSIVIVISGAEALGVKLPSIAFEQPFAVEHDFQRVTDQFHLRFFQLIVKRQRNRAITH